MAHRGCALRDHKANVSTHAIPSPRELIEALELQGWAVSRQGNGHWKAQAPTGTGLVHFARSQESRAMKNTLSDLRRYGFEWPTPKKARAGIELCPLCFDERHPPDKPCPFADRTLPAPAPAPSLSKADPIERAFDEFRAAKILKRDALRALAAARDAVAAAEFEAQRLATELETAEALYRTAKAKLLEDEE